MKRIACPSSATSRMRTRRSMLRQRGLSLVELMVALVIGLFLMGAVSAIYVATSGSSRASTLESQMNEDASLALEMLQQQIRLAGFSGFNAAGARNFQGLGVRGCDGGFTNNAASTDFAAMACGTDENGPDALAIRYQATVLNTQGTGTPLAPSNCSFESLSAWDIGGGVTISLADNRFYIAEDPDNGNIPTLYCKGKTGNPAHTGGFGSAVALVPNIEDMQITYAVTAAPVNNEPLPHQITAYLPASDITDWSRVAGVRVCLLARTSRAAPTGGVSRETLGYYVDCEGEEQENDDGFLRRVYHTTVQLRNMRPAVPAPSAFDADGASIRNPWAYLTEGE